MDSSENYTVDYKHYKHPNAEKYCLFYFSEENKWDVKATSNIQKLHDATPELIPRAKVLVKYKKNNHMAKVVAMSGKYYIR